MMFLLLGVCLACFCHCSAQFGSGNANSFVDSMLEEVLKSGDNTLFLEDEKFVLIVDLLLFSPQVELEVTGSFYHRAWRRAM